MTIRDLIEILKKYPKHYKVYDNSAEAGIIIIRDENKKFIDSLHLWEIMPEDRDWCVNWMNLCGGGIGRRRGTVEMLGTGVSQDGLTCARQKASYGGVL